MHYRRSSQSGITTLFVLGFMGLLMLLLGTLTGYAFQQARYGRALLAREQALHIAEAGLEYYRWFLAHNPGNLTNGTGGAGPYTYVVQDPEGGEMGEAELTVQGNFQCGQLQHIDIESRGISHTDTRFPRTISVRHMQPSIAQYAFLLNTNVWYGAGNVGVGPYFSNGGIRQDGSSNSTVSSARETFTCDSSMGCSPSQSRPGVFGSGSGSDLWRFPEASIDFSGIGANLGALRSYAQSSGRYFQHSNVSSNPNSRGFRIVFKADGTFDAYRVTGTQWASGYRSNGDCASDGGWCTNYDIITSQTFLGNYSVPSSCGLIYAEGTLWLEGVVNGKVTVVAADPGSYAPDILLAGNISYATTDGSTGLTAIAEHSVRIPLNSPNNMSVRGIFVAASGYYGRDYYYPGNTNGNDSYIVRNSLNVIGSIFSFQRPVVTWADSDGDVVSGYQNRTNSYDRVLAFDPPPFTPAVSSDYGYVLWDEE